VGRGLAASPQGTCRLGGSDFVPVAFVHVNKAGGTAMRATLAEHARSQMIEVVGGVPVVRNLQKLGSRFFHASASLQRAAIGPQLWAKAYKFALVRNPWARQVSMFHFLLSHVSCKKPIGARPAHCDERRLPEAGPWLGDVSLASLRFRKWLADIAAHFPPGSTDQHFFGAKSHGNERDPWYNASQISWMVDSSGSLLVDDVFKLEELEAHWPVLQRRICSLANVPYNAGGPKRNPSPHGHYSLYYDNFTRGLVAKYMQADLDHFGYQFESATGAIGGLS